MTPREKIEAAAKATDAIFEHWQEIEGTLGNFVVNGFGVHADPSSLKFHLARLAEQVAKAREIAAATDWPTGADYDAAG